jgi:hypothetical protein
MGKFEGQVSSGGTPPFPDHVPQYSTVAASNSNVANLSSPGFTSIDGVNLSQGDRILLKDQSTASENGIYVFDSNTTPLVRAEDFNEDSEFQYGAIVHVESDSGTNNGNTSWKLTSDTPTVDTDPINFQKHPAVDGGGVANQYAYWSDTDTITSASEANKTGTDPDVIHQFTRIISARGTAAKSGTVQVFNTNNVYQANIKADNLTAARDVNLPDITTCHTMPWKSRQTLTNGASITWDMTTQGPNVNVTLDGTSGTIANPTGIVDGGVGLVFIRVIQDATGSRTVSWGTSFNFAGGTAPTLSTGANAVDVFTFVVERGGTPQLYLIGQALNAS